MRITFVCPAPGLSGGLRVVTTYAERLRRRGHDVTLVALALERRTVREALRGLVRGRPPYTFPAGTATRLDETSAKRIIVSGSTVTARDVPDADLVVATWWLTAEWVWALPPEKGVKVHFIQDHEVWGGAVERVDATCRLPMPKITPSRWLKELLARECDQRDVELVPNSVDLERFRAAPRFKRTRPTVGFTYTDFYNKGTDIALEAIRRAHEALPELRGKSFGIRGPSRALPLPECVDFHLRASEASLRTIYGRCDAWLFASRKEGFGLPILEAMACRTPVIAASSAAAPELLEDGGGVLVPTEDPRAMAEAILEVARMSEREWRSLSDAAHRIAHRYTWEDATDRFERALLRAHDLERGFAGVGDSRGPGA